MMNKLFFEKGRWVVARIKLHCSRCMMRMVVAVRYRFGLVPCLSYVNVVSVGEGEGM
jgi:hypothetical protein